MFAEGIVRPLVLDLNDATTTSIKQLAYRKPIKVSIRDPTTKRIDRLTPMSLIFIPTRMGSIFRLG